MTPLADFRDPATLRAWRIVNDGVMGGMSRSDLRIVDGRATFAGTVSPENNGGFASVRASLASLDIAGMTSIALRVRGDGKRYQFRVRTDNRWDGVAYKHGFETISGQWVDVELPLDDFQATFRGRSVPGAPVLDATGIRQIGFLIADKQFGSFQLDVAWIRVMRDG